jgi:hypothetical protein
MNKHTTDKGVSNSLRGFFERIVKPYISKELTNEHTTLSKQYPMTFEKFVGNMALFRTKVPTYASYNSNNYNAKWSGFKYFSINKNNTKVFTYSSGSNNTQYVNIGAKQRLINNKSISEALSQGLTYKKISALEPLKEKAFPFSNSNSLEYWVNPSDSNDTPNVFYIPNYSKSDSTVSDSQYDNTIQTIGTLKVNDSNDIGYDYTFGYYSKIETRKEKCCFYKINNTDSSVSLDPQQNILDYELVRSKLVEAFETTDEELESKINKIRILNVKKNEPFICILAEVNENKLVTIVFKGTQRYNNSSNFYYYTYETPSKVEILDIDSRINHSSLVYKIYEIIKYKNEGSSDRYSSTFTRWYFQAILVTNTKVYRLIVDPEIFLLKKYYSNETKYTRYTYYDEPKSILEEATLNDFSISNKNMVLGIIAKDSTSSTNYDAANIYQTQDKLFTYEGMIVFQDAKKTVQNEMNNKQGVETTISDVKETRQPLSIEIKTDNTFNDFRKTVTGTNYGSKSLVQALRNNQGYVAYVGNMTSYPTLQFSPDGISWFATALYVGGPNSLDLKYLFSYSNKRLYFSLDISDYCFGDNFDELFIDNIDLKPVLFKENTAKDESSLTTTNLRGTDIIYLVNMARGDSAEYIPTVELTRTY